ncbi:MAG: hypothetical protein WD231_00975 [Candidatus Woykebacteria bacterium]
MTFKFFKLIPIIILIIVILSILFALYRTWKIQHSDNQKIFLSGKLPSPKLDGFYKGSVNGRDSLSWKGKIFNAAENSGVNKIEDSERYKFKTSEGKGLQDKNIGVLKLNYNVSGNPIWLRTLLDEIVETEPGVYLGKIHLRIIPGLPFTIGYFNLER